MKKLIQGIVEFRKNVRPGYRETFARLALGQSPDALFIACSDSRVVPNLFASTEPGDLFVVRNPGNLIAPCGESGRPLCDDSQGAAIEFATLVLGVSDVIVCGHSECGAIRMLMEGMKGLPAPNLGAWLRHAEGVLGKDRASLRTGSNLPPHHQLSQLNVLLQLEHLGTYSVVQERLGAGRLRLHGWWFDIAQAEVFAYDVTRGGFVVIDEAEAGRLQRRMKGTSS
jgi:carbonic anhydrase